MRTKCWNVLQLGSFLISTFLGYILGQNLLYLSATFLSQYTQHHPDHNTLLQAFLLYINACGKKKNETISKVSTNRGLSLVSSVNLVSHGGRWDHDMEKITRGQHVRHNSTLFSWVKCGFGDVMGKGREKLLWEALSEILYVHKHAAVTGEIAQQKPLTSSTFFDLYVYLLLHCEGRGGI